MRESTLKRTVIAGLVLALTAAPMAAKDPKKARKKIDKAAEKSLERLFEESPESEALFDKSFGYAAFDGREAALMISSGGGHGVAVERESSERTYMRVASAGVGVGIGIQATQTVFLFEDKATFDEFVESGWDADGSASAAAGDEGMNTKASFVNGMAIYQMTKKGLIAQASVKGTKYWKDGDLNER